MNRTLAFFLALGSVATQTLIVGAQTPQYLPVKPPMPNPALPATEYRTASNNPGTLSTYGGNQANWWGYLHNTPTYTGTYFSDGLDVVFPNDSLWEGDWTNSASVTCSGPNTAVPQYSQNRQAEQIRIALQAQYGYGGTGLMPLINVMSCPTLQVNPELYSASPAAIATSQLIGPQYSTYGSVVQMATGQVITWNGGGLPYTFVRTYCADNASSNAITVAIDGVSVGTACGTHNGSAIARVATSSPNQPYTNHSTTFTCVTGPCYMYGAEGRPSTGAGNAGVRVHNTSVGSAPSGWFAGHTEFEDLISDGNGCSNGNAQLVIYAMGTNDAAYSVSLATYQANYTSYITHAQTRCQYPAVVIYRPGIDGIGSQSYFASLTAYAQAHNLLVIDQTNRWGTTYSSSNWYLGNDTIHMNDAGNLDAASTMLSALLDTPKAAPINPLAGDTGLNAGIYRVTAPPFSGFIGAPGYAWHNVPGIPSEKGIFGWQTGNANGLAGTIGLYDPAVNLVAWMTNSANDFCVHVPGTSGNFSTCTGYNFRVVKSTGEVDTHSNVLDDGSGNASAAGTYRANGGLKAGASGSLIPDTRALVQSVVFCTGGGAACSQSTLQSAHMVVGFTALSGGTITVTGIPAYTSSSTYWCNVTDASAAAAAKFLPVSGTSFTITGTGADTVVYTCTGF